MCINLNLSICDLLPSNCGVRNSRGCVCFCVMVKRRGGKQGGNKHLVDTGHRMSDTSYTQMGAISAKTDNSQVRRLNRNVSNILTCM